MEKKIEDPDNPYVSSTVLKFITKSKDYLESDGQIEGFIPDTSLNNTSANINTGREIRKLHYTNAPTRTFIIKYKIADLFNFCHDY